MYILRRRWTRTTARARRGEEVARACPVQVCLSTAMAEDFDPSTPCWPALGQPSDPSRLNETWEETFPVSPCTDVDRRFARLLAIPRASSPQVRQPSSVLAFHPSPTTHHPPPPPPPPPPTALTPDCCGVPFARGAPSLGPSNSSQPPFALAQECISFMSTSSWSCWHAYHLCKPQCRWARFVLCALSVYVLHALSPHSSRDHCAWNSGPGWRNCLLNTCCYFKKKYCLHQMTKARHSLAHGYRACDLFGWAHGRIQVA